MSFIEYFSSMMNINGMPEKVYRERISPDLKPEDYTLKFGMHRGVKLQDVPREYLEWILTSVKNRPDAVEMIQKFMRWGPSPPPSISTVRGRLIKKTHTIAGLASKYDVPPAPRAVRADGGKGLRRVWGVPSFANYQSLIANHYRTSKEYDIEEFTERGLFLYRVCMDSCRRMRSVIESQEESPASLQKLSVIYRGI